MNKNKMTREEAIKNVVAYAYMKCDELPKDVYIAFDVLINTSKTFDKAIEEIENAPTLDYQLHLTKTQVIRKDVILEILKRNIGE